MRRGHSDLRLDAANKWTPENALMYHPKQQGQQQQQHPSFYDDRYYYYKNPRYSHEAEDASGRRGSGQGHQGHLKELVHSQHQLEPQRYKTIIFLSGR